MRHCAAPARCQAQRGRLLLQRALPPHRSCRKSRQARLVALPCLAKAPWLLRRCRHRRADAPRRSQCHQSARVLWHHARVHVLPFPTPETPPCHPGSSHLLRHARKPARNRPATTRHPAHKAAPYPSAETQKRRPPRQSRRALPPGARRRCGWRPPPLPLRPSACAMIPSRHARLRYCPRADWKAAPGKASAAIQSPAFH